MIDIKGLDKAAVLLALWQATKPLGFGIRIEAARNGRPLSRKEAQRYVDELPRLYFDYVEGRPIKADLSGDQLDPEVFDRDAGEGAAAAAIAKLRAEAGG